MAPSLDCAFSSLLCSEDNAIFDDINDYETTVEEFEDDRRRNRNMSFVGIGEEEFSVLSDECLGLMIEKECQYSPRFDYLKRYQNRDLDIGARKEAVRWILKVNDHFCFGSLCAYFAISYLDRFLSTYELPKGKLWTMHLLAVACLSLAAKMEETDVPLSLDLQVGESKFVFEARTIQRMELLVLSTLSWRMRAITPFSFIDSFLPKINNNNDQIPLRVLIVRSIRVILSTIQGIEFLEFRASEIAAAVAISVYGDTEKAISGLIQHVEKERVLKCLQLVQNLSLINGSVKVERGLLQSVPNSPSGVLDVACLSYKSEDTAIESCADSFSGSPGAKRRRLDQPCEVKL